MTSWKHQMLGFLALFWTLPIDTLALRVNSASALNVEAFGIGQIKLDNASLRFSRLLPGLMSERTRSSVRNKLAVVYGSDVSQRLCKRNGTHSLQRCIVAALQTQWRAITAIFASRVSQAAPVAATNRSDSATRSDATHHNESAFNRIVAALQPQWGAFAAIFAGQVSLAAPIASTNRSVVATRSDTTAAGKPAVILYLQALRSTPHSQSSTFQTSQASRLQGSLLAALGFRRNSTVLRRPEWTPYWETVLRRHWNQASRVDAFAVSSGSGLASAAKPKLFVRPDHLDSGMCTQYVIFGTLNLLAAWVFVHRGGAYVREESERQQGRLQPRSSNDAQPPLLVLHGHLQRSALANRGPRGKKQRRRVVHNLVAFAAFVVAMANLLGVYQVSCLAGLSWRFAARSLGSALLVVALGYASGATDQDVCPAATLAASAWGLLGCAASSPDLPVHWGFFLAGVLCGVGASSEVARLARDAAESIHHRAQAVSDLGSFCGILYCCVWLAEDGSASRWQISSSLGTFLSSSVDLLLVVGCGHLISKSGQHLDIAMGVVDPPVAQHVGPWPTDVVT